MRSTGRTYRQPRLATGLLSGWQMRWHIFRLDYSRWMRKDLREEHAQEKAQPQRAVYSAHRLLWLVAADRQGSAIVAHGHRGCFDPWQSLALRWRPADDPQTSIRRVPLVLPQDQSQDRQAAQPWHFCQPCRRREARARGAVLQAALTTV